MPAQHGLQVDQHRGAAAQHQPVVLDIERRLADILEQLAALDQVGDAAAIAERLARDGRVIDELLAREVAEEFVLEQIGDHFLAVA